MPRPKKGEETVKLPKDTADIPPAIGNEAKNAWTDAYFRMYMRGAIRKVYFLWPGRAEVINRARVELKVRKKDGKGDKKAVWYKCEQCERLCKPSITKNQAALLAAWKRECKANAKAGLPEPERPDVPYRIWCDHKEPVVGLDGSAPDWHTYIFRTFVGPDKMQALCDTCHSDITKEQNAVRRENVKARKINSL